MGNFLLGISLLYCFFRPNFQGLQFSNHPKATDFLEGFQYGKWQYGLSDFQQRDTKTRE